MLIKYYELASVGSVIMTRTIDSEDPRVRLLDNQYVYIAEKNDERYDRLSELVVPCHRNFNELKKEVVEWKERELKNLQETIQKLKDQKEL